MSCVQYVVDMQEHKEIFLFVAENLKKYFSIFFKSLFFLLLILLIAHLGDFLHLPSSGGKLTTLKAGLQLALNLVIIIIPATLIIVSGLFFAFPYSISRGLLFKVIPLIVFLNTILLSAFLFYPNNLSENAYPIQKEVQPQFEKNKIYEFNNTAFYINNSAHSNQFSGLFIMQHPFFVENAQYTPPLLTIHSSLHYEGEELLRQNIHIKVPISLKNRPAPIFPFGLTLANSISIDFIHTKRVFESVFPTKKPMISILSRILQELLLVSFSPALNQGLFLSLIR